jgi:hypothetical protein
MDENEEVCASCEVEMDLNDDGECLECEREALTRKAEYMRDMAEDR